MWKQTADSCTFWPEDGFFLFPIIRTSYQLFSKATVSWEIPSTQLHTTSNNIWCHFSCLQLQNVYLLLPNSFPLTWDMRLPRINDMNTYTLYSKHSKTHVWNCYSNIWAPTPCGAWTGVAERLLAYYSLCGAIAKFTKRLLAYYRHFRTSTGLLRPF